MDINAEARLDATFAALGDQTRRAMLARLVGADQTVSALAAPFDMTLAAISKHLQILLRAGLISQTKQGRETLCRAEPAGVQAALVWLESCGQLDSEDFSAIERLLAGVMDDEALLSGEIFDPDSDFA
jgi:DNA-binding transcriptional ArsR family regulator